MTGLWRVLAQSPAEKLQGVPGAGGALGLLRGPRGTPGEVCGTPRSWGGVCGETTLRRSWGEVCLGADDGSKLLHRGALIRNILSLLPSALLTSPVGCGSEVDMHNDQLRLSSVPSQPCGDPRAKGLQTLRVGTAYRSATRLDRPGQVCYAGLRGACVGGRRTKSAEVWAEVSASNEDSHHWVEFRCPWCQLPVDPEDEFNVSEYEGEPWHDSCIQECEEQRKIDGDD